MKLPRHNCGLYITHNEHKDVYDTVEERMQNKYLDVHDFLSAEDMQKCIDTNELWEIQWYPDTPVGSYTICGSSLDAILTAAIKVQEEADEQSK